MEEEKENNTGRLQAEQDDVLEIVNCVQYLKNVSETCPSLRSTIKRNTFIRSVDKTALYDIKFNYDKAPTLWHIPRQIDISGNPSKRASLLPPGSTVFTSRCTDQPNMFELCKIKPMHTKWDIQTHLDYLGDERITDHPVMARAVSLVDSCPYDTVYIENVIVEHDECEEPPSVNLCFGANGRFSIPAMVYALSKTQTVATFSVMPVLLRITLVIFNPAFIVVDAACKPKRVTFKVDPSSATSFADKEKIHGLTNIWYLFFMQEMDSIRYAYALYYNSGFFGYDCNYHTKFYAATTTITDTP